ncbi:MAG: HlyD family efflux transporter periplasmic adaptor subunit [Parvularculaceae bacterium]
MVISALRSRPRPDNIPTERRASPGNAGRWVYLLLLGALALTLADYFWGDLVIFRADGMILRDRTMIAATYLAEVERVGVREGEEVAAGQVVLRLKSVDILERLAALSSQHADLVRQIAEYRVRSRLASELTPLAVRRESESEALVTNFDALAGAGLVTAQERDDALRAQLEAKEMRVQFETARETLAREIPAIEKARRDVASALDDLILNYGGGEIRAPAGGAVGADIPFVGTVYRPGDPILTIYSGKPYCLVYLPSRYLPSITVGLRVNVTGGRRKARGVIAEILPVSDALPKEFQNMFRPQDRNQLAKIIFDEPAPFSINEKVRVSLDLPALVFGGAARLDGGGDPPVDKALRDGL